MGDARRWGGDARRFNGRGSSHRPTSSHPPAAVLAAAPTQAADQRPCPAAGSHGCNRGVARENQFADAPKLALWLLFVGCRRLENIPSRIILGVRTPCATRGGA